VCASPPAAAAPTAAASTAPMAAAAGQQLHPFRKVLSPGATICPNHKNVCPHSPTPLRPSSAHTAALTPTSSQHPNPLSIPPPPTHTHKHTHPDIPAAEAVGALVHVAVGAHSRQVCWLSCQVSCHVMTKLATVTVAACCQHERRAQSATSSSICILTGLQQCEQCRGRRVGGRGGRGVAGVPA
jgi:hypothetical protein